MQLGLWKLPEEDRRRIIEVSLDHHGRIIGELETPNYKILTLDTGALPRYLVAKVPKIRIDDSGERVREKIEKFLYEVNAARQFGFHPFAQRFTKIEMVLGVPVVLSRMRDKTLSDVIAEGTVRPHVALSIAFQLLHVLECFSRRGLEAHQDIKPANVFVSLVASHFVLRGSNNCPYMVFLGDFGLANAYKNLGKSHGSRPYVAPEMYGVSEESTSFAKVDVFAVGVMLHEMLTGGIHPVGVETSLVWPSPIEGVSRSWQREDKWKRWAREEIRDLSRIADASVRELVRLCLERDVHLRPSVTKAKEFCFNRLLQLSPDAALEIKLRADQADEVSKLDNEDGWPSYDAALQELNEFYKSY